MSPRELEETDMQRVLDWVTILSQEAELAKEKQPRG